MTQSGNDDYYRYKEIFKNARMPLAFIDLEKFDANVSYVAATQKATGKTIRVGTKSVRCVELTRRIFRKGGTAYRGILGFTMEEAAFLAEKGFNDIIVAYPTVQESDIRLFLELVKAKKKVSLMVDSEEQMALLSAAAEKGNTILPLCLEVDMAYRPLGPAVHLGVRRSPVRSVEQALELARASRRCRGISIDALMGYEAHIASIGDNVPGKRFMNRAYHLLKRISSRELTARRDSIVEALRKDGLALSVVNGGGSGSLNYSGRDPDLTEVTAGSAFYCSGLFRNFRDIRFTPAAFFAIRVARKPAPGMVTCLGGGYAASGAAGAEKLPVPVLPEGMRLLPLEGAGEVQTPLLLPKGCPDLGIGDPVFFQHAKSGELCERFNELYLIEGNKIISTVKTYRGEGKAFL